VWLLEIAMKTPVRGRYIKIKTDWDDRNDDFSHALKAEFENNVDKLIKVYYNAETRDEGYEYDALGNRTVESVTLKGKSEEIKNYGYYADGSRLRSNGKWVYVYDANGNVVKKGDTIDIGGVITKVKDAASYLNTITDSVNEIQFSVADKGTYWQYEYDLMNRMIKVRKNNEEIVEYTYSWKGYRVKKEKLNATADELKTTYYIFSPNGKLLYQEEEKYGDETANFYRQYDYLFNKLFAKDVGRVGTTTADARFYYHTDHLGSVTAITDEAGDTAWGNEFTPFGSAADSGNMPDGGFKFATYAYDEDINLNYACMRWSDPETGRFTSLDPSRDGVNWYVYCGNNPIAYVDPAGLEYTSYGEYWGWDANNLESNTPGPDIVTSYGEFFGYEANNYSTLNDSGTGSNVTIPGETSYNNNYNAAKIISDNEKRKQIEGKINGHFDFSGDTPEAREKLKYDFISALLYLYQSKEAKERIEAVIASGHQITISLFNIKHQAAEYDPGIDKEHVTIYWDPSLGAIRKYSNTEAVAFDKKHPDLALASAAIVLGHELAGHGYQDLVQNKLDSQKYREYNERSKIDKYDVEALEMKCYILYGDRKYGAAAWGSVNGGIEFDAVESFEKPVISELNSWGFHEAIRDNYFDGRFGFRTTQSVTSVL
jgi:RHS repeat-associated protein